MVFIDTSMLVGFAAIITSISSLVWAERRKP